MTPKVFLNIIIGSLGVIACAFIPDSSAWFRVALGLLIAGIIDLLVYLYENRKQLGMLQVHFARPNRSIRITTAYLFRIEKNGKYLLIKRHKKDMVGYQPVGGAYKYFKEENRKLFDELGITPCTKIAPDSDTENDLRIILKRRKKLPKYLKWLAGRENREIDPTREFDEELVVPGLLPEEAFRHFKYNYVGKHQEFDRNSPLGIDEFRYADIFELRVETDAQRKAIQALEANSDEVIFASAEEINKGRTNNGKVILPHTFKILPK
jgi:hypothetical protein